MFVRIAQISIFLSILSLKNVWSHELERINGEILFGDVTLTDDQYEELFGNGTDRNAKPNKAWPNGIVPYTLSTDFDEFHKNRILSAIAHMNEVLGGCLNIRPKVATDGDYVAIERHHSTFCHAFWGYKKGKGKHVINLLPGWSGANYCTSRFVVVHEFLHGLGLMHEHQRPDRDDYIWVDFDNVKDGYKGQYNICKKCVTYDIPYDPQSIMQYPAYSYCKDCSKLVMHSRMDGVTSQELGTGMELTANDILKLKKLYGCDTATSSTISTSTTTTTTTPTTTTTTSLGCKFPQFKGDTYCDDENNNPGCDYDGGDCCGDNVKATWCNECMCKDPNSCRDNYEACGHWTGLGYCGHGGQAWIDFMKTNCQKACDFC